MRTITTAAGIGDFLWIAQKLINQPERFNWIIPGGKPRRVHQLASMLPQIINRMDFSEGLKFEKIRRHNARGPWKAIRGNQFFLEANSHLESGRTIEDFLPDLPTVYRLPFETNIQSFSDNERFFLTEIQYSQKPCIGIYGSSYSTSRSWGFWQEKGWFDLIELIGDQYNFVIIGAEWDTDLSTPLMKLMDGKYDYVNTVGQRLQVVAEVLKRLHCFIGFPSGLSILNELIGAKQTVMFYPPHLQKLMNAWPDPARIESGQYKGCLFCEPKQIYSWMKERGIL